MRKGDWVGILGGIAFAATWILVSGGDFWPGILGGIVFAGVWLFLDRKTGQDG